MMRAEMSRLINDTLEWMNEATAHIRELEARLAEAEAIMRPLVLMLDALVAESGKGYDWGVEDAFRRGEWFTDEDTTAISRARAFLEGKG